MNVVKSIKKLSLSTKIQLVIAIILTIVLAITIPTYSWFNYERRVAELAKIKSPDNLYINAAHKEDVIHLDMSSIDLTKKIPNTDTPITAQSFVFSVSGEWVNSFTLQIEHTTNNPFTYTFYEGTVYPSKAAMLSAHPECDTRNATDGSLPYVEYIATNEYDAEEIRKKIAGYPDSIPPTEFSTTDAHGATSYFSQIPKGQTYYIWYGDTETNYIKNKTGDCGQYLNLKETTRIINEGTPEETTEIITERYAGDLLKEKSYEGNQTYNRYALPVYWQLKNIGAGVNKGSSFYKTYIVKVSWTGQDMDAYKKETDLFYISAFVS